MDFLYNKEADTKVLAEQIKTLYQNLPTILAGPYAVSVGTVYVLWDVVAHSVLITWLGLITLLSFIRLLGYIGYRREFSPDQLGRHVRNLVLASAISGVVWGFGCFMIFPENGLEYQLFILFVLVCMGAASVNALTMLLPAFIVYFPVSMLPVTIMLFWLGEPIYYYSGMMISAFSITMFYFGISTNRNLTQTLQLRFENVDLVEQLREQKNEAEQANISKSRFLASASHDLRQPLHALTLFTSVLDELIQSPKERKVVDQINASVEALQQLFNALLDISRLEVGVMKVEKTDFYLQHMFDKLANDFNPQVREKGLHIDWSKCTYVVHTDQSLLEQILRNYISNAIRYTSSGGIFISCNKINGQICIQVTDEGIGIPQDEQRAIFEEFHQLSNPERDRSKGLGLGLAIVQRAAKLLGHDIGVESVLGKGSTFSISVESGTEAEAVAVASVAQATNDESIDNTLIVVIDDEVSVLEGMQTLLHLWGCDVIVASDLNDALKKIRQQTKIPEGIIADYRLRDNQTGIDAIQALHTEYNMDIPALIITGDLAVTGSKGFSGRYQVLHKPVAPVKLRTFLRHIQQKHELAF